MLAPVVVHLVSIPTPNNTEFSILWTRKSETSRFRENGREQRIRGQNVGLGGVRQVHKMGGSSIVETAELSSITREKPAGELAGRRIGESCSILREWLANR